MALSGRVGFAPLNVIGLMSGTSLDGVDAALLRTDGERVLAHGPALTRPYPSELRASLRALLDRAADLAPTDPDLLAATRALSLLHGEAVQQLRLLAPDMPAELVGFHGQTILHAPASLVCGSADAREENAGRTWQVGDAALLSAMTDLPVIHDFRSADVRAGGEGAPLAPLYHAALLAGQARPVAVLNLGGVANLTLVRANGDVLACDTGPGNALLDDWAMRHTGRPFDQDGALARAGRVDTAVLEAMLAHPFFARPAPKSLDRLTFHGALALLEGLGPEDGAATLAALTAQAVACTPLPEQPKAWFVCGGGRHNPALMQALAEALPAPVQAVEALGWKGDALEAECFGFLAVRSLRGLPLSLPATTGVPAPQSGGRLTCGGITPYAHATWLPFTS
ncbi:MAG: anhydro-N-acetylmuramic acid kinase [Acetobacter peroxydans]|jgi:anhydro-N-acetylmuramic acid kinase|nr:anhydro-N-acetylmuramic acid kinase [Acetobacter peroxydans]MCI2079233.1 anhydro-N-acetylmuramic acid kinase [Acetobacter peroxydans]